MGALYILTFQNGKQYIGITSQTTELRFARHWKKSIAGQDNAVNRALRKYGRDAVSARTLVIADDWGYLCLLEKSAIKAYNTLAPNGYNCTLGGEGVLGLPCEPATREKISKANTGRKLTEAQKGKISAALRARGPVSSETRGKLSVANTGKVMPPDIRRKCGLANIGRVMGPEAKAKQRATVIAKGGGVCFDKARQRWLAYVKVDRKTKILGRFDTEALAREAREQALSEISLQGKRR